MPRDFITINQTLATAKYSGELKRFVETVREVLDLGQKVKGVMDHNTDGSNYADIEALFGLPTDNGDEVYNLVAGTLGALMGTVQSADALTLIDRIG